MGTKRGQARKTARRAYMKRNNQFGRGPRRPKKMKFDIRAFNNAFPFTGPSLGLAKKKRAMFSYQVRRSKITWGPK